jgi:hypothetical protein
MERICKPFRLVGVKHAARVVADTLDACSRRRALSWLLEVRLNIEGRPFCFYRRNEKKEQTSNAEEDACSQGAELRWLIGVKQ